VRFDDATGLPLAGTPLELKHARALKEATCEQAKTMELTGEAADGTPFAGGSFGPLKLEAASGGSEGSDPRYSDGARDVLISAGLRSTRVRG
jgi:hypothetical protein